MANFTAADVKRLRDLTGSGMLDCKNALAETEGDFDQAVELLRIKGAKDVGKRADRTAGNGLVAVDGGAMLELACETDFVAKNEEFQALADQILRTAVAAKLDDVDQVLNSDLGGTTVSEAIAELSAKIGEKLELRRYVRFDGTVATYAHRRSSDLPPAVGVLVEFTGSDAEVARAAAMQIAAMKPAYVSRDEVPEEVVATESRIAEQSAREEGKPEQALPKIVEGRVNGFYKSTVLLEQSSVQESKKTVKALLDEAGVIVTRFARFEVGQA